MRRRWCAGVLLALMAVPLAGRSEEIAQAVSTDRGCAVLADARWSTPERFVWERVCLGQVADFNKEAGYGGDLDPRKLPALPESRILTPAFLETILLNDKYRVVLPRQGVRITGARFAEMIDLAGAELRHPLLLNRSLLERGANLEELRTAHRIAFDGSRVAGALNMAGIHIDGTLSMTEGAVFDSINLISGEVGEQIRLGGSKVLGTLNMDSLRVHKGLFMREQAEFAEIVLRGARVDDDVDLSGSKITGKLVMAGIRVGRNLYMYPRRGRDPTTGRDWNQPAEFAAVDLLGAQVGEQIDLSGSRITGLLTMERLRGEGNLLMGNGASFADVKLNGAHISGLISLEGSKVGGRLSMESLRVDGPVFLWNGAEFMGPINLLFGKIGGLELSNGRFHGEVNLTGTEIAAQLGLGTATSKSIHWDETSTLILRNASADALQDADVETCWPVILDLTGFKYRNLGGFDKTAAVPMANRSADWFEHWLAKQSHYSPQPYEQLAAVLRGQGRPDVADEVLYASRERERLEASSGSTYVWQTALKLVVGYGYRVWLTFFWFAALLVIGAAVQWTRPGAPKHDVRRLLVYSFEMLLPVVRFRGQTRDFPFGWQEVYFHVHGLVGIALTGFLGAGLAGLTR